MPKPFALITCLIILLLFCAAAVSSVGAQTKKLTVPDEYPSISSAIAKAQDGDTIFVRNGIYNESALEINKSIKLIGEDKNDTVLNLSPKPKVLTGQFWLPPFTKPSSISITVYGPILSVTADNVTLAGFTFKSQIYQWSGIALDRNRTEIFSNQIIGGITGSGNNLQIINNTVSDSISLSGSNLTIAQNILANSVWCYGSYNVLFSNQVRNPYQASWMDDDMNGPWFSVSAGAYALVINNTVNAGGLALHGNESIAAQNTIRSSLWVNGSKQTIFSNNLTRGGLIVTGHDNTFLANNLAGYSKNSPNYYKLHKVNVSEIQALPYELSLGRDFDFVDFELSGQNYVNNTFYHNNFNGTVVRVWDGVVGPNFWGLNGEGNYWSNYSGTDKNGDGVGDTPYVLDVRDRNYNAVNVTGLLDPYPLMVPFNGTAGVFLPAWAPSFVVAMVPTPTPHPSTEVFPPNQAVYITATIGALAVIGATLLLIKRRYQKIANK
jgi:hypothetical protein